MERPAVAINDMSDRYYISQCNRSSQRNQVNSDSFTLSHWLPCFSSAENQNFSWEWVFTILYFLEANFVTLNHLFKPAAKLLFFQLSKGKGQATVALAMKISCFASCQESWHLFNQMPNALSTEGCWKKKTCQHAAEFDQKPLMANLTW